VGPQAQDLLDRPDGESGPVSHVQRRQDGEQSEGSESQAAEARQGEADHDRGVEREEPPPAIAADAAPLRRPAARKTKAERKAATKAVGRTYLTLKMSGCFQRIRALTSPTV